MINFCAPLTLLIAICTCITSVASQAGCSQPETWQQRGAGPGGLTQEGLEHLHDAGNALLTSPAVLAHSGMAAGLPDTDWLQKCGDRTQDNIESD